ncbi:MAG: tRNA (N6-isopentenyl adenosine(37)-C2)-methylthiotransferase MiaB [Candidatus Marinimicrobia bacterium]|nr:tRNA (N6-isopentenyl adenosine(37)-C2)-methylthiotransferase MiaB [Candidatus Neomarinimicrobiota bacterium]
MQKRFYIETYGCQMNEYDSEILTGILQTHNYILCDTPEEADIILLNTCSVREHAEQKIHSRLGELKNLKDKNPDLKLGVIGCMAQNLKNDIIKSKPYVNMILGPDAYRNIFKHLGAKEKHIVDTKLSKFEVYDGLFPARKEGINAWISIMRGCNKFCAYCIVPYTRGRERSRSIESIVEEAKRSIDLGFVEITLLGQNVNSYVHEDKKFPKLLEAMTKIDGLKRLRYTSPHPQDVDEELMRIHADYKPLIANHIHLPLQAGSDSVLKAMNRTYSQEHYLGLVEMIRKYVPDMGITTDIIVGFPGESDEDFRETLKVMEQVKFDSAYTFKYSPRPHTKAWEMDDNVSEVEKSDRLTELIILQKKHTLDRYRELIGSEVEILVETRSKKSPDEMRGRTACNKIVIFPKEDHKPKNLIKRKITDAQGVTLFSRPNN